jgi:MoaA/NifB/PqqE/SkfB family radical SAM enzyme
LTQVKNLGDAPSAPALESHRAAGVLRRGARLALPAVKLGARRLLHVKSPFQMTLSLTNRCNLRCTYCEIPLQERDEMSTAEWLAAIDELQAGGMGRASLIGGEPLLRNDAGKIIRHLKRRGVHASMNTNGWLVAERIEDVADLDLVCVSLDGPEAIHDAQRHRGSYARAIRALDTLRQRNIPTVTMTVVTPAGIDHVEHVLEIAHECGIIAYFHLEHGKEMDVLQPISPALSQVRIAQLARHLRDLKRRGLPVGNSYEALERQESERYLITCDNCYAGSYFGYVFSDGTVSHCIFTQAQVERGNGRDRGYVRAFQELAAPEGPGCSCVPYHEVNRMLSFDMRVLFGALDVALRSAVR